MSINQAQLWTERNVLETDRIYSLLPPEVRMVVSRSRCKYEFPTKQVRIENNFWVRCDSPAHALETYNQTYLGIRQCLQEFCPHMQNLRYVWGMYSEGICQHRDHGQILILLYLSKPEPITEEDARRRFEELL